jgi:hypothetical protein
MCKRFCKMPKLKLSSSEWRGNKYKKASRFHWVVFFGVICCLVVWMSRDISNAADYEYNGTNSPNSPAIEISGVDFVSEEIQKHHQSLGFYMKWQSDIVSEDVLFAFQFTSKNRMMDHHVFLLSDGGRAFGNAKVIRESEDKIKCTEEYGGELRGVVRSKRVTIKAIDIEEWKQVEYTSSNPKESCMIQHAIDILELKWV